MRHAKLHPSEYETLRIAANMLANGYAAPWLLNGEVRLVDSFMQAKPFEGIYGFMMCAPKGELEDAQECRDFLLLLLAFTLTVGNVK